MEIAWTKWIIGTVVVLVTHQLPLTRAHPVGVCYGMQGDNLPTPKEVIGLYQSGQIEMIRLYDPNPEVLDALRGSNLKVSLGVRNEDIQDLASGEYPAQTWVSNNILKYKDDVSFGWITVGNEVISGPLAQYVLQAMLNIYNVLNYYQLNTIQVTTVVPMNVLATSYPPSAGAFSSETAEVMTNVATFCSQYGSPLMINVYPYFAYVSEPENISMDYVMFDAKEPVVDGNYTYYSLFDAMVDGFIAALEKVGLPNVPLAVSESGWPTAGNEPYTSIPNARTYNMNLYNHVVGSGTPRRPQTLMPTFFFSMFNEDLKPAGAEQHFGFLYPNMTPVYPFW